MATSEAWTADAGRACVVNDGDVEGVLALRGAVYLDDDLSVPGSDGATGHFNPGDGRRSADGGVGESSGRRGVNRHVRAAGDDVCSAGDGDRVTGLHTAREVGVADVGCGVVAI
eukprot:scaffold1102_cov256-Pinguiococcus_pyrenoidosus.AAC.15